jgi:hypothetical protein
MQAYHPNATPIYVDYPRERISADLRVPPLSRLMAERLRLQKGTPIHPDDLGMLTVAHPRVHVLRLKRPQHDRPARQYWAPRSPCWRVCSHHRSQCLCPPWVVSRDVGASRWSLPPALSAKAASASNAGAVATESFWSLLEITVEQGTPKSTPPTVARRRPTRPRRLRQWASISCDGVIVGLGRSS